jgi:signal transduction histidine kinase
VLSFHPRAALFGGLVEHLGDYLSTRLDALPVVAVFGVPGILVANATRYADRDSTIRVEIDALTVGEVRLAVANRGATIEPAHAPRLFDRFFCGDSKRSDTHKNHGLGPAIVAAIACKHGGQPFAS